MEMNGSWIREIIDITTDTGMELEANVNDNNVVIHFPDNKTGDAGKQALLVRPRNCNKATDKDIYRVCELTKKYTLIIENLHLL